jgi:peroxiredoxin
MAMKRRFLAGFNSWFIVGVLALSLGLNLYLIFRLRHSRDPARPALVEGARAPDFSGIEATGKRTKIMWNSGNSPVVLYVFNETCIWCQRNMANVISMHGAAGQHYRFIGLALNPGRGEKLLDAKALGFQVLTSPQTEAERPFVVRSTPTTALILPGGRIVSVWQGAYAGAIQKQVESRLGIKLPGLTGGEVSNVPLN